MDDIEVLRDPDLWVGGLEEIPVDMLYQETLECKLAGSKITNYDTIRLAIRLSELSIKPIDSSQVKEKSPSSEDTTSVYRFNGPNGHWLKPHHKNCYWFGRTLGK